MATYGIILQSIIHQMYIPEFHDLWHESPHALHRSDIDKCLDVFSLNTKIDLFDFYVSVYSNIMDFNKV